MAEQGGEQRRTVAPERVAMELCCEAYQVSIHEMMLASRSRAQACYARQVAMYLSHVVGKVHLGQISTAFQRDRSTVAHACHIIEDRRDSPVFDREIEVLEGRFRELMSRLHEDILRQIVDDNGSARRA